MTTVVNVRVDAYDVYIGRAGHGFDGYFGNPFRVQSGNALEKFRAYFNFRIESDPTFRRRVLDLRGKRLGCFCAPGPCHGDVLAEWIESQPEEVIPMQSHRTKTRAPSHQQRPEHQQEKGDLNR